MDKINAIAMELALEGLKNGFTVKIELKPLVDDTATVLPGVQKMTSELMSNNMELLRQPNSAA